MKTFLSLSLLTAAAAKPNPIRRVVTMLQEMQKEIGVERETEAKMFEKYQCYVKQTTTELTAKVQEAADTHKAQKAAGEGFSAQEATLGQEIEDAKKQRADAKTKLEAETKKRTEEQATFSASDKDVVSDIAAIKRATTAIEKGTGGGEFLQTNAVMVKKLIERVANSAAAESHLDVVGQEVLQSFLQNPSASYSSQSGEIVGILKQMGEDMQKDADEAVAAEAASKKAFAEMSASLNEIVASSGTAIEEKSMQKGEVAVKAVEALNAAKNAKKQKEDDEATLKALTAEFEEKTANFHSNQAEAAAEIEAIGQAIEILNNDDALELFKKTDTKADFIQLSLLQVSKKAHKSPKAAVTEQLSAIQKDATSATLAMLAFSAKQGLNAKKVDFSKILKMIDDMVALLKQEQKDDRAAMDQCNVDLNKAAMDKKDLDHKLKENNAVVEDLEATITTQTAVIDQANTDIKNANDASSQATKQRTEENAVFVEDLDLNKQAVELLLKAKDKMNAFYNPDQVRKGNRQETSEEAAARASESFLEQAPETAGPRAKKTQKSGNVLALMDQIVNELNSEVQKLETGEKQAQKDYEELTADLAKQIADSEAARSEAAEVKGSAEENLANEKEDLNVNTEQSMALAKYTSERTAACEFITTNFESRKSRREAEIAGLGKAKSILSGANFE